MCDVGELLTYCGDGVAGGLDQLIVAVCFECEFTGDIFVSHHSRIVKVAGVLWGAEAGEPPLASDTVAPFWVDIG